MRKNTSTESKYTVDEAVKRLKQKLDIKVDTNQKYIYILSNTLENGAPNHEKKHDVGIRTLGKIDFLVNYQGFRVIKVYSLR